MFYSLQSIYLRNLKPIALAVSELFAAVRKIKMQPGDLVLDLCDLVLYSLIVLLIGNVRIKFEVCSLVTAEI